MMSAGNDIVALDAIDRERTNQPRFYSRILAHSEQELYQRLEAPKPPFENFVWLLWSIKESVYKYRQRIETDLVFSPTRIVIRQIDSSPTDGLLLPGFYRCTVHMGSGIFYSRSEMREEWIATVVSPEENFEGVRWGVATIDRSDRAAQSAAVRALALDKLHEHLFRREDDTHDLRIGKSPSGYPIVLRGVEKMDIPISLAHHDRFVAYSFYAPATGGSSRDAL